MACLGFGQFVQVQYLEKEVAAILLLGSHYCNVFYDSLDHPVSKILFWEKNKFP